MSLALALPIEPAGLWARNRFAQAAKPHNRDGCVRPLAWRLRWSAAFDKNRREGWQPLTWDAYSAILTAFYWRRKTDEGGEWLIPGRGGKPYRYQSWWYHFDEACRAAGVARERYQGAHGFRKAGGNVLELTGDPKLALDWIRDTDPRRMREYLKVRNDGSGRSPSAWAHPKVL